MTVAALKLWEAGDAIEIVRVWMEEHDEEIRANEGVIPDELAELLAQVEGDFKTKAERVALFVRELSANGKAIKEEEDRLRDRRKSFESQASRLKLYLEMQMLAHGVPRVDGKLVTLRIQKNPPAVHHELTQDDLRLVLEEYVRVVPETRSLNKEAVLAHWKQTGESPIDGVTVTQGASLRIA